MTITSISNTFVAAATARAAAPASGQLPSADARVAINTESALATSVTGTTLAQQTQAQIYQAVEQMKQALPPVARNLQFSVDDDTGQTVVKVVDATTDEVIRQIPSEELLAITKALDSFTGLLVKQEV